MIAHKFNEELVRRCKFFALLCSILAISIGTLTLVGWGLDIAHLKSLFTGYVSMNPVTGLCFIFGGASLWLNLDETPTSRKIRKIAAVFAYCIALVGLIRLLDYIFNWETGLDQWLFREKLGTNQIAPNTALIFFLLGCALLSSDLPSSNENRISQACVLVSWMFSLLPLVGYLNGAASTPSTSRYIPMALNTAIAFNLLCIGMLCARPQRGLMKVIVSEGNGGKTARRLLPSAILLPILLGWLSLVGEREGLYPPAQGFSLFICIIIFLSGGLIWWHARVLNQEEADRQRRQEEIRDTQTFVDSIVENIPNMIFVKDSKDLRFVRFNRAGEELLGMAQQELIGKTDYDFFPKDEADFFTAKDRAVLEGKKLFEIPEEQIHTKSKGVRILRTKKIPILDVHGAPLYLLGISEDVTEQKQAEIALQRAKDELEIRVQERTKELSAANDSLRKEITHRQRTEKALNESETRNRYILESSLDAVVTMDSSGKISGWSSQAEKIFGWKQHEALGKDLVNILIPTSYRDAHVHGLQRFLKTGEGPILRKRIEMPALHKNGKEFPVELSISPLDFGGAIHFGAFLRDLTESKQAERERMQLAAIVASTGDAIVGKSLSGIVTSWNQSAERLYGYTAEEMIGQPITHIFPPERVSELATILNTIKNGERIESFETTRRRKDGKLVQVSLTISPIKRFDGQLVGASTIARDISEAKKAEEALKRYSTELQRSNQELAQFAYVASHDLQEPLRMVTSYMQLIEKRYQNKIDAEGKQFISYAVDGSKRMETMINDLLAFSRVGKEEELAESVPLQETLNLALQNLQRSIQESEATIDAAALPTIPGHRSLLVQLFQNLISNAIKFRGSSALQIQISAIQQNNHWLIAVKDNGIGIESRHSEKIFRVFQRLHEKAKYPGSGIGLAIAKKIVEYHRGKIWVESEPGKGSTFFFTLMKNGN